MNKNDKITSIEKVAIFLNKSSRSVYQYWKELGGKKIGGTIFFPSEEEILNYIFSKSKETNRIVPKPGNNENNDSPIIDTNIRRHKKLFN